MVAFALGPGAERRTRLGFLLAIGLILLPVAGKAVLSDTLDPDCFWHLRVADQLHDEGIRPVVDRLSFASLQSRWSPYSWLAELGMRWVWHEAGWRGAVLVQALLQAAFVILLAAACRARAQDTEPQAEPDLRGPGVTARGAFRCVLGTALGALLALPYLSFRPVTAAVVVLAAIAALIVRDRQRGEKTVVVWGVIPLTMLAVNLHLYALLIPVWFATLLGGALWERARDVNPSQRSEKDRRVERYALLMVFSGFACLATPMLPGVIGSALHYQFADAMVAGPFIREMQPFFSGAAGPVAGIAFLLFAVSAWINRSELRAGEFIWLLLSCCLLLRMGRFATVFAVVAAPIFAASLPSFSDRFLGKPVVCAAMSLCLALGVWRVANTFPSQRQTLDAWLNRNGPRSAGYPCAAADFVACHVNGRSHRLINEFDWGGYLEWRLGDKYQTLLDGRTQVFAPELWQATYLGEAEERKRFLSTIDADVAILPVRESHFQQALLELGWKPAYRDDRAEVLLPPPQSASTGQADWPSASVLFGE